LRYARPTCEQCIRLRTESAALYLEYFEAKGTIKLTPKNDGTYHERRLALDKVWGQVKESWKRDRVHEATHHDEFSLTGGWAMLITNIAGYPCWPRRTFSDETGSRYPHYNSAGDAPRLYRVADMDRARDRECDCV
jgi:hypothetical protein